ncbi:MAG: Stp1/IreP family PP2C-type Ser/Thr phosphatase [Terracidiphilus sp.]
MKVAGLTDVGRKRQGNEDCFWADEASGLLVLADGMGGHAAGEVASDLAVRTVAVLMGAPMEDSGDPDAVSERMAQAIAAANRRIVQAAAADSTLKGMGTTIVVAVCGPERVHLAHVGDSRAYLLHDGALRLLTRDHSLVAEMVTAGEITEQEAQNHPLRSVLSRSLGQPSDAKPDLAVVDWEPGDRLLLCSDGLTNMVDDEMLEAILRFHGNDLAAACQQLVAAANAGGGLDNITAIVVAPEAG